MTIIIIIIIVTLINVFRFLPQIEQLMKDRCEISSDYTFFPFQTLKMRPLLLSLNSDWIRTLPFDMTYNHNNYNCFDSTSESRIYEAVSLTVTNTSTHIFRHNHTQCNILEFPNVENYAILLSLKVHFISIFLLPPFPSYPNLHRTHTLTNSSMKCWNGDPSG